MKTLLAARSAQGWARLRAGAGTKGLRWYGWRSLADPADPTWRRWLLVRPTCSDPTQRTACVVFAPQGTALVEVVRVAGTRWTVESGFEAAKGKVGLHRARLDGLVSPYHARKVGLRVLGHDAGEDAGRGGGSGKEAALPSPPPLRTVRAPFNAYRSSTEKPRFTGAGPKTFTILTAAVVHHWRDAGPRQQLKAAPSSTNPCEPRAQLSRDSAPRGSRPGFPWDDLA